MTCQRRTDDLLILIIGVLMFGLVLMEDGQISPSFAALGIGALISLRVVLIAVRGSANIEENESSAMTSLLREYNPVGSTASTFPVDEYKADNGDCSYQRAFSPVLTSQLDN